MESDQTAATRPLIVFVHVPKAGGSTVNRHLRLYSANGLDHCQRFIADEKALSRRMGDADWISGHITQRPFARVLSRLTDRPLRFFTCVRDPVNQVASHYNWLVRLRRKSLLSYLRYPAEVREISARLRASDNSDPQIVIANLKAYDRFFLNVQNRYVFGGQPNQQPANVEEGLNRYEAVADSEHIDALVARMTGRPITAIHRENASPYAVDAAIFHSDPVRRFLERANARDNALYETVRARMTRIERPACR